MPASEECFLFLNGRRWPCQDGDVVGRAGTVALEELKMVEVLSRRHLRVERSLEGWRLVALEESRNETFLDGVPISRGVPCRLDSMHTVRVDAFEFHVGLADGLATQFWSQAPGFSQELAAGGAGEKGFFPTGALESGGLTEVPLPAVETDAHLNILAANSAALALLGGEALGGDLDQWCRDGAVVRDRLLGLEIGERRIMEDVALSLAHGERVAALHVSRLESGLLVLLRDVTDEALQGRENARMRGLLSRQSEVLAGLSLAEAFHAGDVPRSLTLLTHRAAEALDCARVSAWLRVDGGASAGRKIMCQACHDTRGRAGVGQVTDLAYCPLFFDALAGEEPWAEAEPGSPVLNLLVEIGFASADAAGLLCVGLRRDGEIQGVLAFERAGGQRGGWAREDRHFALCLASYGVLALQTHERHEALAQAQESRRRLVAELEEANRYVQRILPDPITSGPITAEWEMLPSEALGGDSFGYHWVGDLFVMYVLDVVGHGTGMALLSISVLNTVRARLLLGEEAMADPARVLQELNAAFPMENQNNMLFSMWYGVFDRRSRVLTYASAGHPPALLLEADEDRAAEEMDYAALGTEGPSIGALDEVEYSNGCIRIAPGSKLFIYTDGAFEMTIGSGREWTFEEFVAVVRSTRFMPGGETAYLRKRIAAICAQPCFPDDFTMVRFTFEE